MLNIAIKLIKNSKTLSSPAPVQLDPRVERPNNKLYNTNGSNHTHRPEVHAHRLSLREDSPASCLRVHRLCPDCVLYPGGVPGVHPGVPGASRLWLMRAVKWPSIETGRKPSYRVTWSYLESGGKCMFLMFTNVSEYIHNIFLCIFYVIKLPQ